VLRENGEHLKMTNYRKTIFAGGSLGADDYKRVLAGIHRSVNEQQYSSIELDFSRLTSAYAYGILPIISYVRELQLSHVDFSLILPQAESQARRFRTYGWANLIEPRAYDPPRRTTTGAIPALTFKTAVEQQNCVNTIIDNVLSSVENLGRSDFAAARVFGLTKQIKGSCSAMICWTRS